MRVIKQIKRFLLLPKIEQYDLVIACLWIIWMRIVVWLTPNARLSKALGKAITGETLQHVKIYKNQRILQMRQSFQRACRILPFTNACLVYALAARKWLQRYQLPTIFYLGANKKDDYYIFHAWLSCAGLDFVGQENSQELVVIAKFIIEK